MGSRGQRPGLRGRARYRVPDSLAIPWGRRRTMRSVEIDRPWRGFGMPERAHATIRSVLRETPDVEVRYVEALTSDGYFVREDRGGRVMFVNPIHRSLIDELRRRTSRIRGDRADYGT